VSAVSTTDDKWPAMMCNSTYWTDVVVLYDYILVLGSMVIMGWS